MCQPRFLFKHSTMVWNAFCCGCFSPSDKHNSHYLFSSYSYQSELHPPHALPPGTLPPHGSKSYFTLLYQKPFLVPMIFFSEHPLSSFSSPSPPSLPLPLTHGISFPAKSSGIKIQWTHMAGHSIREFYDRHWEVVWAYFVVCVELQLQNVVSEVCSLNTE